MILESPEVSDEPVLTILELCSIHYKTSIFHYVLRSPVANLRWVNIEEKKLDLRFKAEGTLPFI